MNKKAFSALALLLAASSFAATPLHRYTFDASGVFDSVGSADGTLLGGANVSSGALELNGTNAYVQFRQELLPSNNFSVAFFARELAPTSDRAELISQGYMFGPGFYFGYYPPDRSLRVGDQWQGTGLKFPGDGIMHHYAVTSDLAGARLYMDGACVATNLPIQIVSGGYPTRLGQQYDPWGEFFHGTVDDVWIFSGSLSEAQVARLAAGKPPGPTLSIETSQVRLCWDSETNVLYQLQYRSELTTNIWTDLGAPVEGNGTKIYTTDQVVTPRRYYRVVALP